MTANNGGPDCIDFAATAGDVMAVLAEQGCVHVPDFVGADVLNFLKPWVAQQQFNRHDEDTRSGVRQRLEVVEEQNLHVEGYGSFFIGAVERWVRSSRVGWRSLETWQVTDIALQRYGADDGITPHRDYRSQHGPIVVVSLVGEAEFMVHETRHKPPVMTYRVRSGDAVFLRGDLGFEKSARPVHSVSAPLTAEPRISLGLRHDKRIRTD